MIATKTKISYTCTCGAKHPKQLGFCHICRKFNTITATDVTPKPKRLSPISPKRRAQIESSKGVVSDLDLFFEKVREIELKGAMVCESCNCSLKSALNSDENYLWKGCIAHIVPKSKFDSVKCEINNYMLLCLQDHSNFDHSWENAKKMPVFKIAKERFNLFRHLITESLSHLPNELLN